MSGTIIPTPDYKAADGQSFGTQVEKGRLGDIPLSLTNYDNNSVPQIAAGSCVEISGSIFQFPSNDTITGTPTADNINYIMLTVSGSGDSQEVEASWTTTAPTWNTSKQGWYDATNAKRYIGSCWYDGTNYMMKRIDKGYGSAISCFKQKMITLIGSTNPTYNISFTGNNVVMYENGTSGKIPVNLPNGAIVIKAEVWGTVLQAGTPDSHIEIELQRSDNTINVDTMAEIDLTEGNGNASDSTIVNAVIDNANYCYYIYFYTTQIHTTERIYGIQITYLDRTDEGA